MKKPLILVTGIRAPYSTSHMYMNIEAVFNAVEDAGGLPVLPSFYKDEEAIAALVERVDGVFLTGGEDVDPSLYGEETLPECGATSPERDAFELAVLKYALAADKAIFCVCRGSQIFNVAQGGTLYQDLPTQHPGDIAHLQDGNFSQPTHTVEIVDKDSFLYKTMGTTTLDVNTTHHQNVKDVAPGLKVTAMSPDGLVEGTENPDKFFAVACQWHPEMLTGSEQYKKLFAGFIAAARER